MRRPAAPLVTCLSRGAIFCLVAAWWHSVGFAQQREPDAILTLARLRQAAHGGLIHTSPLDLQAKVLWIAAAQGRMILRDASAIEEIHTDLPISDVAVGNEIRFAGKSVIREKGAAIDMAPAPVVNNDGIHGMTEKSGTVYLETGPQPLRVTWFNRTEKYGLEVSCEGPGVTRHVLDEAEFTCADPKADPANPGRVPGLQYRSYSGSWVEMPDFGNLSPIQSGIANGFDLNKGPIAYAAMEFSGFLTVPRAGLYTFYTKSDDGSLLFIGAPSLKVTVSRSDAEPGILLAETPPGASYLPGDVEGIVLFLSEHRGGLDIDLDSAGERLSLEVADASGVAPIPFLNQRIRATGLKQRVVDNHGRETGARFFVQSTREIQLLEATLSQGEFQSAPDASLPLLTTADQVRRLKAAEARRGYPVKLRGVTTCQFGSEAAVIQDSTSGIYFEYLDCLLSTMGSRPETGSFYEIEGTTAPGNFSPIINVKTMTNLGPAILPEPRQIRWDQIMNGSLDSQYAEIGGVVTEVHDRGLTLLTDGRSLQIETNNLSASSLTPYQDGVVRIRGCLLALWDEATHQVKSGHVRIYSASISLEQAPPSDPFLAQAKSIPDLRLFDAQAASFQRVKVTGQIIHRESGLFYLSDGTHGLRFQAKAGNFAEMGDRVEVVGFPELGGAAPMLRDAVVRKTGHDSLPPEKVLSTKGLFDPSLDSTLVRVESLLLNVHETLAGEILELKTGSTVYTARSIAKDDAIKSLVPGSLLDVTGVYAARSGGPDREVGSFEILLTSPSSIKVIAQPPWWTPRRAAAAVSALLVIIGTAAIWILTLRRKVEEKTGALRQEIEGHERTEAKLERKTRLLETEIEERKQIEAEMEKMHSLLLTASRKAGMAEVATGVLHNIGNVLNGVDLSLTALTDQLNGRRADRLERIAQVLSEHSDHLASFLNEDPKGKLIPEFLNQLVKEKSAERTSLLEECRALRKSVEHVKEVVAMQQDHATRICGLEELTDLQELAREASRITAPEFEQQHVTLAHEFAAVPAIRVDKHRLLQILVNLLKNAAAACGASEGPAKQVTLRLNSSARDSATLEVEDNGIGIPAENLSRLFGQGFTTRANGHGFGLHSSALIAKEIGAKLTAHSEGVGRGALFRLELRA